ncbi:MAG: DUF3396 domain-containing protein [Myxococcales bacterium]|nr:DUF3396 domain-containing protein [Myxococcales bacterium]MCB9714271.1 DUF3396 domain-containing protein [Myxococcales bacterium]
MTNNPLCLLDDRGRPIVELKTRLVLWLEGPPSPRMARDLYDLYMQRFGSHVRMYCSTAPGSGPRQWTPGTRHSFENQDLPKLRRFTTWGYGLSDGQETDSWLFMFHGARPHSEKGRASFCRFDFPWDVDPMLVHELALEVIGMIPFRSGSGGPFFQISATSLAVSLDRMYAWARRYWGIDAQNLDVTMWHALEGITGVSWLTLLGGYYLERFPEAVEEAQAVAFAWQRKQHGLLLRVEERPRIIDRNRNEPLGGYGAVARALLPLQVRSHEGFGGEKWTADETLRYLRRFTGG